jgi:hypothetical protein
MKNLKAIALLLCITMVYATKAQTGQSAKPKLFENYPQTINFSEAELAKVFATPTDNVVSMDCQSNFSLSGIVTTANDVDAIKFSLANNSNVLLNIIPYNIGANYVGANLDVKAELYNSTGTLIKTYDPEI